LYIKIEVVSYTRPHLDEWTFRRILTDRELVGYRCL